MSPHSRVMVKALWTTKWEMVAILREMATSVVASAERRLVIEDIDNVFNYNLLTVRKQVAPQSQYGSSRYSSYGPGSVGS